MGTHRAGSGRSVRHSCRRRARRSRFALFHVGRLERLDVDAYTRADITGEWRFSSRLSLMVVGQNLLDAAHLEFAGENSLLLADPDPAQRSGAAAMVVLMMCILGHRAGWLGLASIALAAAVVAAPELAAYGTAQIPPDISSVKAGFLFNFAKFTEWPALPRARPS